MKHFSLLLSIAIAPLASSAMQLNPFVINPSCTNANGSISLNPTGGVAPYTYVWAPVPPNGQGTPNATGLLAGSYSVTVTDAVATELVGNYTLIGQPLNVMGNLTWVYDGSAAHHPCPGMQNGSICVVTSLINGVAPYTVTVNGQGPLGYDINTNEPYFGYFGSTDQMWVNVTDATGCTGSTQLMSDSPPSLGASASNINPACGGMSNGSAELIFGYAGPYGPELQVLGPLGTAYSGTPWMEPWSLTGLVGGMYTVYGQYSPIYFPDPGCFFSGSFEIPDLGSDCGTVSGRLFIDNNQNCVQNGGEPSVPFRVLEITPGPEYAITNVAGDYTRNLINGNFSIEPLGTDLYPLCPPVQPAPFTINTNSVTLNLADSSLLALDLAVDVAHSVARPGFAHSIWGWVHNQGGQVSGPVTLTVNFDPIMSYTSASPTPTSVLGNTITWDLPAFTAFGQMNFGVQLQVPPDAGLIGQAYSHTVNVSQPLMESTLANNTEGENDIIQGSYDPNHKQVLTSTQQQENIFIINQDEWLDYVVRFQNTGTDTAFTVVVTDTISVALDLSTYEQGVASHPFDVSFKSGRVVEWRFADILLPDSNVNEAASHGLVSFRIRPHLPLLPGTVLANNADIFFDFNDPIRTNDAVVTAEFSTGVGAAAAKEGLMVYPNPANDQLVIDLPGAAWICLLDLTGRVVLEARANVDRTVLAFDTVPAGAYVLHVTNAEGRSFTRPVTKN